MYIVHSAMLFCLKNESEKLPAFLVTINIFFLGALFKTLYKSGQYTFCQENPGGLLKALVTRAACKLRPRKVSQLVCKHLLAHSAELEKRIS